MKILAISDLRVHDIRHVERIAERVRPDLILYAGDNVARFGPGQNSWSPLAKRTPLGLAGIIGNDCAPSDAAALEQPGCWNLHRAPLILDGVAFLGLQGAPSDDCRPIGQNLYSRRQAKLHLAGQLALADRRPVILVSHAPPRGVLDYAIRFGAESIGSSAVRKFIGCTNVKAVVCGHVHLHGGRVQRVEQCSVVNVASHDEAGAPLRYAVLEWDGAQLQVTVGTEKDDRGLAALAGVGPHRAERLERAGFHSLSDLLDADDDALATVCSDRKVARRLRATARARHTGRPVLLDAEATFPEGSVIVDVETSLLQDDPWLVGFKRFGAQTVQQIQEIAPQRHRLHLARIGAALGRPSYRRLVHWGAFDRGALRRAHRKVGIAEPAWLLEAGRWLNAEKWVRDTVALPLPNFKLKTVAAHFGYHFSNSDVDGQLVGYWYSMFCDRGTPFDVTKVRAYNRDDVASVETVISAVRELLSPGETMLEPPVKFSKKARPHRPRRAR